MKVESTTLAFQSKSNNITRKIFINNRNLTSKIKNDVVNINKKIFNKTYLKKEFIRMTEVFFDPKA